MEIKVELESERDTYEASMITAQSLLNTVGKLIGSGKRQLSVTEMLLAAQAQAALAQADVMQAQVQATQAQTEQLKRIADMLCKQIAPDPQDYESEEAFRAAQREYWGV